MNKLKIKFIIPTCLPLIQSNIQVLSQNQSLYCFINNKSEELASSAFETSANEVLHPRENNVRFNSSSINLCPSPGIFLYQLEVYSTHGRQENLFKLKKCYYINKHNYFYGMS